MEINDNEVFALRQSLEVHQAIIKKNWSQFLDENGVNSGRNKNAMDFYTFMMHRIADTLSKLQEKR